MILEGFTIENWSCIPRLVVEDLPPTGVVVLHGPNGTGKSSAIEAIRSCLMDKKSTSKSINRGFPRNSQKKPKVSVTFRASGTTWRITKQFGGKESLLESRIPSGLWKTETVDPSEAHERARQLSGGCDSNVGLHQLLWLTQAEFQLPKPKDFDADVQSRLKSLLGVLQTPLDDRFLASIKEDWSKWFSVRNKPGERPKLKPNCPLDKDLALLKRYESELAAIEDDYRNYEGMIARSSRLEADSRDLRGQLVERTRHRDRLQREYEESRARLEAHRQATETLTRSETTVAEALAARERRLLDEQRIRDEEAARDKARREVDDTAERLRSAETRLRELRHDLQKLGFQRRETQKALDALNERRASMAILEQFRAARDKHRQAEGAAGRLEELTRQARDRPAPDDATLARLDENRRAASGFRADLDASTITLAIEPDPGSVPAVLAIDGESTMAGPPRFSIRRRAEIRIPGWGRAEVIRGSDVKSLDTIEDELKRLDRQYADALGPFGIGPGDPTALDQLRGLAAEAKLRAPELKRREKELRELAPKGLEALRAVAEELERGLQSRGVEPSADPGSSAAISRLETEADRWKQDLQRIETEGANLNATIESLESRIEGRPEVKPAGRKAGSGAKVADSANDLRLADAEANQRLIQHNARLDSFRDALAQQPTAEQVEGNLELAQATHARALEEWKSSKLNEDEQTVLERLNAVIDGCREFEKRTAEVERELQELRGALGQSEGLHQKRSAAAIRVEELSLRTQKETLESEAVDRLYALFEECREKQLGAVMGPIHDRIVRWMRLLRIGGYHQIQFNDQFLPETLIARDGAHELALGEESTGTIEQIALMVRLALGSSLSTVDEPVVAVLDDPLTHSDVERLEMMRAVLKNASAGDPGPATPAGPLQILVFTCHPEWFAIDGAKVIDLSRAIHSTAD